MCVAHKTTRLRERFDLSLSKAWLLKSKAIRRDCSQFDESAFQVSNYWNLPWSLWDLRITSTIFFPCHLNFLRIELKVRFSFVALWIVRKIRNNDNQIGMSFQQSSRLEISEVIVGHRNFSLCKRIQFVVMCGCDLFMFESKIVQPNVLAFHLQNQAQLTKNWIILPISPNESSNFDMFELFISQHFNLQIQSWFSCHIATIPEFRLIANMRDHRSDGFDLALSNRFQCRDHWLKLHDNLQQVWQPSWLAVSHKMATLSRSVQKFATTKWKLEIKWGSFANLPILVIRMFRNLQVKTNVFKEVNL